MQTTFGSAPDLIAGAAGSGIVALAAFRLRALTRSGAWAATACGTLLYGAGGWAWVALVGVFFVTSSILTRVESGPPARRVQPLDRARSLDRMGRRWDQVVANGGIATLAAAVHGFTGAPLAFAAAAGAIAVATADTWATEIGRWSRVPPRLITTWTAVPQGTSGGITPVGTIGAAAGAALIGGLTALLALGGRLVPEVRPGYLALVAAVAGFSGALLDSVLGATIEKWWPWVGNSGVNLVATTWGAGLALLAAGW